MRTCCPEPELEWTRWRSGSDRPFSQQCQNCFKRVGRFLDSKRLADEGVDPAGVAWKKVKPSFRGPGNSKRRNYSAYIRSSAFRKLRERVLQRDNWTCRNCGEPATDAGHLNYDRFGEERLDDLIAQCSECNQEERERRISGVG